METGQISLLNTLMVKRDYGACDFEINFKHGVIEPRQSIQGDIARIYFYMNETYNVPLTQNE